MNLEILKPVSDSPFQKFLITLSLLLLEIITVDNHNRVWKKSSAVVLGPFPSIKFLTRAKISQNISSVHSGLDAMLSIDNFRVRWSGSCKRWSKDISSRTTFSFEINDNCLHNSRVIRTSLSSVVANLWFAISLWVIQERSKIISFLASSVQSCSQTHCKNWKVSTWMLAKYNWYCPCTAFPASSAASWISANTSGRESKVFGNIFKRKWKILCQNGIKSNIGRRSRSRKLSILLAVFLSLFGSSSKIANKHTRVAGLGSSEKARLQNSMISFKSSPSGRSSETFKTSSVAFTVKSVSCLCLWRNTSRVCFNKSFEIPFAASNWSDNEAILGWTQNWLTWLKNISILSLSLGILKSLQFLLISNKTFQKYEMVDWYG